MENGKREKLLIVVALVSLCALAGDKLILNPLMNLWDSKSERIVQLEKSVLKGELLLSRERVLRKRWREMERDALPNDVSLAENQVFKAVDRWVNESRINLSSFKPQWRQNEEEYMTMECHAVAQGSLEEIARFLYELETDPLALKVESVELTERDNAGRLLTMGIRFSGIQFMEEEEI